VIRPRLTGDRLIRLKSLVHLWVQATSISRFTYKSNGHCSTWVNPKISVIPVAIALGWMIDYLSTSDTTSFLYNSEKGLCQLCLSLRLSVSALLQLAMALKSHHFHQVDFNTKINGMVWLHQFQFICLYKFRPTAIVSFLRQVHTQW
jgi:hypothetical protein